MPTRIIIQNATILTLDDEDTFHSPGVLEIRDDRIFAIGAWDAERKVGSVPDDGFEGETTVIDGTDRLVMPGLVDLHFHTSLAKGYEDNLPLREYLDTVWYPSIRALTPATARTAALYSYTTALKSGTTTVNDMYRHLDALAGAAAQTGIRAVLSCDVAAPQHRLDSVADNIAAFHALRGAADGRVTVWLGLEWLPLSDAPLLAELAAARRALDTGLHLHLCESRGEVADSVARFGQRPVEVARAAGLLGPHTVAAHCVHLTDEDIATLAATGTHVAHCAGSNAKLGNGVAAVGALAAAGVNVGLGVDAGECHNSTDLFETMKLAAYLQRAAHEDAARAPPGRCCGWRRATGRARWGSTRGCCARGGRRT